MVFGQPKLTIINQKLEEIVVVPINSISRLLQSTGHYFIQISLDCVNFLNPDFLYAQVNPLFSSGSRHVPCNLLIWVLFFTFSSTLGQLELERQKKNNQDKKYVVLPILVKSPEYIWGAGVASTFYFKLKHDSITRTSNIKAVSFLTLRNQSIVAAEGNIYLPNESYIINVQGSYSHFPDKFWGLGNNTGSGAMEKYAITQYGIIPKLQRNIYSKFYAGIGMEIQNVFDFSYQANGIFDQQDITGRNGGFNSGANLVLSWDNRNEAFSSNKGFYAQFLFGTYGKTFGGQFTYAMKSLDLRKYFAVGKRQVIALQYHILSTSGHVPIRNMATMGSNSYMRGYYEGRYTDHHMAALQAEFRTPVYKKIGMVLFAGAGKVGEKFSDILKPNNLKLSAGFGLRYLLSQKEKLNLRIDAGFGKNSQGTYLNMGEAF